MRGLATTVLIGLSVSASPALAQRSKPAATPPATETTTPARQFDDWKVGCEKAVQGDGQVCFAFQMLQHAVSKRTLGYISIGYPAAGQQPLAIINLPLGMLLPGGAVLQVDGTSPPAKADAPIKVCYAEGCRAELPFDSRMMAAFRARTTARVAFMNVDDSLIELPISLKGFATAFDSLR